MPIDPQRKIDRESLKKHQKYSKRKKLEVIKVASLMGVHPSGQSRQTKILEGGHQGFIKGL